MIMSLYYSDLRTKTIWTVLSSKLYRYRLLMNLGNDTCSLEKGSEKVLDILKAFKEKSWFSIVLVFFPNIPKIARIL